MSTNTPGGLLMSRMSQNYTSRLSQNVIQGAQPSGDNSHTISNDRSRISKHHSRMSTTAEPYQPEAPEMKRASKSYALGTEISTCLTPPGARVPNWGILPYFQVFSNRMSSI